VYRVKFHFRKRKKWELLKIYKKARQRAYEQTPVRKAREKTPKRRKYKKAYRETPQYKEYQKAYNRTLKGRTRQREYKKTYNKKPRYRAYQAVYRKTPRGCAMARLYRDKNNAIRESRPGTWNVEQIEARLKEFGMKSYRTGKRIQEVSWDHIVPLKNAKSTNWVWNLLPLSLRENTQKNDKDVYHWIAEGLQTGIPIPSPKVMRAIAYAYRRQLGKLALKKAQKSLKEQLIYS
jgi:hypothetical protein